MVAARPVVGLPVAAVPRVGTEEPTEHAQRDADVGLAGVLARLAALDIDRLIGWGLLTEVDGRAYVPEGLRPAVAQAIYAQEAPFRFELEPGAVPLVLE